MSSKKIILRLAVAALPLVLAAPALVVGAEKAASRAAATSYAVDPAASSIKWLGKKVTGQHHGTVAIKEGSVRVTQGQIVGGSFVIDTTSITDLDLEGEYNAKLTGHLKSDDFFSVEKHPTARFEITKVEPAGAADNGATHRITGNLTIKDISNPLTFPATINVTPATVTAEATGVAVDRTLYDIRYGSGKFFKGLGDKVIYDEFWLDISLVAKK